MEKLTFTLNDTDRNREVLKALLTGEMDAQKLKSSLKGRDIEIDVSDLPTIHMQRVVAILENPCYAIEDVRDEQPEVLRTGAEIARRLQAAGFDLY